VNGNKREIEVADFKLSDLRRVNRPADIRGDPVRGILLIGVLFRTD
jgi:hypothetical protein